MHLVDRANNVLPLLLREPRLAQGDIAFVTHSFGGLILQQVLRLANDRSARDGDAADLLRRVSRIIFLGTPHRGVDLATWAGVLRLVVQPSSAVNGLARNDPHLRDLNQWFRHFATSNGIAIQTLTESRRTFCFLVVPPDSSDAGLPSDPIPVDSDHFGIASPSSRQCEIYVHIMNFLKGRISHRGRKTLVDMQTLQSIAIGTVANATALERIEDTLSANAGAAGTSVVIPRELVDAESDRRLAHLRKRRFFVGAKPDEQALRLAADLQVGDLSLASPQAKARGLAWCARLLLAHGERGEAHELLIAARRLANLEEVRIAEAFEQSYSGDLSGALNTLAAVDSPAARSASFIAVKNNKGPNEALDWLGNVGFTIASVDPDGKFFIIATQLNEGRIDDAMSSCIALPAAAFEASPALWHVAASANLASVIPRELVASVVMQPAPNIGSVPLAADTVSLERRRKARELYTRASISAAALDCVDASYDASDRALILGLRDPDSRPSALIELEQSMRDSEHSLRRLPIALQFGLKLDLAAAEREIDRHVTLSGGGSQPAALARLAIARTKSPRESAAYIQKYREELAKHLMPSFLAVVEIASLVESSQVQLADERLQEVLAQDLSPEEREHLTRIVADARESDPTASRERQFASTNALPDLALLVEALERNKDWTRLTTYGAILFERTRDVPTCGIYAQSLFKIGDFRSVVRFLRSNEDFLTASAPLQSLLAWALYNTGDVTGCRTLLSQLRTRRDNSEDRALTVNVAIASGDWNSLASFVEQEWEQRSARTAEQLLRAGQIANQLMSTRAIALVTEAASKAADDPELLLGCYSVAMSAGWEDDATFKWLERAAALSGADGPVQRMSLKDIVDRQPDWQRRETQAWEQLHAGLIPMVACGRMLNRTLIELSLLPALANSETIDPRGRALVYSFSGSRQVSAELPQSLSIDPTALLNLGILGILGELLKAVPRVVIPHSTLGWLFEEKQRIRFHQPSRIADAHEVRRLIESRILQRFDVTAQVNEDLANEVGRDLASLFAEAEADWGEDHRPRRVVRSGPVHRAGSLMEEEADLGSHVTCVCGCLDVLDALVRQGRVTQAEEQRSRAFLKLHETPWAGTTAVESGSVLYLDGVSLAHFQHLRLLTRFEGSGFTVMLASSDIIEGDHRVRYEALAGRASAIIENIREALSDGIASGSVVIAPKSGNDDGEDSPFEHPALDIVRTSPHADVAVIDDRYLNQHATITHDGVTTPIRTTCDLLAGLQFDADSLAEHMTRLRAAGLAFVPMSLKELCALLQRAGTAGGSVVETAELKALRENLQLCRMSTGLQLPKEAVWFDNIVRVLMDTIKLQWNDGADYEVARSRSNWLLQQLDLRGWSHRLINEHNRGVSQLRFRAQLLALMASSVEASAATRSLYWEWLNQALVNDVSTQQPQLYEALVSDVSRLIEDVVARQQTESADAE